MNVISAKGGKVHTPHPLKSDVLPECRASGQPDTGTSYQATDAPVDCKNCLRYVEARAAIADACDGLAPHELALRAEVRALAHGRQDPPQRVLADKVGDVFNITHREMDQLKDRLMKVAAAAVAWALTLDTGPAEQGNSEPAEQAAPAPVEPAQAKPTRRPNPLYADIIRHALTSVDYPGDDATVTLVEDLMRDGRTGLDHLDRDQLIFLARNCFENARELHEMKFLRAYCHSFDLPLPAWAA